MTDLLNPWDESDYESRLAAFDEAVARARGFDDPTRSTSHPLRGDESLLRIADASRGTRLASLHIAHHAP